MAERNPYDELPYRSRPVEWSAPERLALCSLLHGGPRVGLDRYRVLELGCGDGSNLIPLAYYRRHAQFVGVDGSRRAIEAAESKRRELGLSNLRFVHADFEHAAAQLPERFEFVLMQGVLSWVDERVRDRLLALCADKLAASGLLYLNYNARPGWNVRGLVRDILLVQTRACAELASRVRLAQELATRAARSFAESDHPYSQLMEREFRFVYESDPSYVAHEFLAPDNHAYWRSEFLALARAAGLHYIADADFNYDTGRLPEDIEQRIHDAGFDAQPLEDMIDLFSYRQLHSPILTNRNDPAVAPSLTELSRLYVAAALQPLPGEPGASARFRHASGFEVEARSEAMRSAFEKLAACAPRGLPAAGLFADMAAAAEDLKLLHRHGMIELRLVEPAELPPAADLHDCERRAAGHCTDAYHRVRLVEADAAEA
jgi:SAM-dependent methyltransferase